jgi:hypothetical protein
VISLSESDLDAMVAEQRARNSGLSSGDTPSHEELEVLEAFWNQHFHTMRDWVPVVSIVDAEVQKLTSRHSSPAAVALVLTRLAALMKLGLIGSEVLERDDGSPSSAKLWLTTDGAMHFATGFPKALRNPLAFAKRHLSLFQLVAVIVTLLLGVLTFVGRLFGWVG